jgi:hypothetical protein
MTAFEKSEAGGCVRLAGLVGMAVFVGVLEAVIVAVIGVVGVDPYF